MKKISFKGFTLIELLVVIAIIALLASIILASLNTARSKARDAVRIQSLQEMGKAIAIQDADPVPSLDGCTTDGDLASNCTGTSANPGSLNFASYTDPSAAGAGVCTTTSGAPCEYMITGDGDPGGITTANFEICTYLENGMNGGIAGMYSIATTSPGSVVSGCY